MIKALFWCFAMLSVLLGVLHYVDIRVASMPRLDDASGRDDGAPLSDTPVGTIDA